MSSNKQTVDTRICFDCQRENAPYAVRCFYCGSPLMVPDTLPLPIENSTEEDYLALETIEHEGLYKDALVLYVLEYTQAAIVIEKTDVILGRYATGDTAPGDLSAFDAYARGVSRHHALISYTKQQYTIKDLGSANGTWVNSRRLPPHEPYGLNKSDRIWLGKLALMVYLAD
ncbi:MAG TPA: FHA domain-containing protein [Aggregatilineaceae bacterium]|nr:FHA domain-containing protein [Aggregatilineaceae bacterium]